MAEIDTSTPNCPRCGWSVVQYEGCPRDWSQPGAPVLTRAEWEALYRNETTPANG